MCLEQRGDDLAVGVEHPGQVGVGPRPGPVGVEQPELAGLVGGAALVDLAQAGQDLGWVSHLVRP